MFPMPNWPNCQAILPASMIWR